MDEGWGGEREKITEGVEYSKNREGERVQSIITASSVALEL